MSGMEELEEVNYNDKKIFYRYISDAEYKKIKDATSNEGDEFIFDMGGKCNIFFTDQEYTDSADAMRGVALTYLPEWRIKFKIKGTSKIKIYKNPNAEKAKQLAYAEFVPINSINYFKKIVDCYSVKGGGANEFIIKVEELGDKKVIFLEAEKLTDNTYYAKWNRLCEDIFDEDYNLTSDKKKCIDDKRKELYQELNNEEKIITSLFSGFGKKAEGILSEYEDEEQKEIFGCVAKMLKLFGEDDVFISSLISFLYKKKRDTIENEIKKISKPQENK